jgi:hypothetical protein
MGPSDGGLVWLSNGAIVNVTIAFTDDQLAAIAHQVAELLRDQSRTQEAPTDDRELLRVADAAAVAGLSRKTIYNYLSDGRLTRYGQSRVPMVSRSQLLALIGRDVREPGRQAPARRRSLSKGK